TKYKVLRFVSRFKYAVIYILFACAFSIQVQAQVLTSPDNNLKLTFELDEKGAPSYQLSFKGKAVIDPSTLGLELSDKPSMLEGFSVTNTAETSVDENWEP